MQNLHDISGSQPSSAQMGELAHALERAEFDGEPELQAREYANAVDHFAIPKHPALRAYVSARARIQQNRPLPKIDPKHPRKCVEAARGYFESQCRSFEDRVQHREQGGLRRLVDAYFRREIARSDLLSLEYQEKRLRSKKRTAKDAERAAESEKAFAKACREAVEGLCHGS